MYMEQDQEDLFWACDDNDLGQGHDVIRAFHIGVECKRSRALEVTV